MTNSLSRRRRLEELLVLAAAYRNWNVRQLGVALARDPSNLLPASGIPKIDFVARLADALDWPVADLLEHLEPETFRRRAHRVHSDHAARADEPVHPLDEEEASLRLALVRAEEAESAAATPEARVHAALALAEALAAAGRPLPRSDALQRGLRWTTGSPLARALVLVRIAEAHRDDGRPLEACCVASEAMRLLADQHSFDARAMRAEATLVRGLAGRDLAEDLDSDASAATDALRRLELAEILLCETGVGDRLRDIEAKRLVVRGAILELESIIGRRDGGSALRTLLDLLGGLVDPSSEPRRALVEAHGWCAVWGFGLAMRHLPESPGLHRMLAILSNKVDEIASHLDCWPLRERVLRMEHQRRALSRGATKSLDPKPSVDRREPDHEEWVLDRDDIRTVVGCIARSRRFRQIGLDMLKGATLIAASPARGNCEQAASEDIHEATCEASA